MKIEANEKSEIILKEVFSGVGLETDSGDLFGICMRDSGFEFSYGGFWYEAKDGKVSVFSKMNNQESNTKTKQIEGMVCDGKYER
ncbi:MAG: hypothetical protein WC343_11265 [Bacilli bacterium]|jgi:hypothetical protein